MIIKKSKSEIESIRVSGKVIAKCLKLIKESVEPGVTTTGDIDKLVEKLVKENKAKASFKNYRGYPSSVCVSVNDVVVHGIPDGRILLEGDLVGIDLGVMLNGWHADAAFTFAVGNKTTELSEKLMKVTREALYKGIEKAVPGKRLGDIGNAIQMHVEANGFSVVRSLVGHGIGRKLHEDPNVPNYGRAGTGVRLEEGMILAIEPMVNAGHYEVRTLDDNWTVVTEDKSLSAHYEHTVAITKDGPDILTIDKLGESCY